MPLTHIWNANVTKSLLNYCHVAIGLHDYAITLQESCPQAFAIFLFCSTGLSCTDYVSPMHNVCVSRTVCESWEPCTCVSHFKIFLWTCNQHVDTYQWATIYIGLIHMALIIYTLPSAYPHIHTHCVKYCWWARWLDIHNRQVLGRNATRKMDTCHHWPPTQ